MTLRPEMRLDAKTWRLQLKIQYMFKAPVNAIVSSARTVSQIRQYIQLMGLKYHTLDLSLIHI